MGTKIQDSWNLGGPQSTASPPVAPPWDRRGALWQSSFGVPASHTALRRYLSRDQERALCNQVPGDEVSRRHFAEAIKYSYMNDVFDSANLHAHVRQTRRGGQSFRRDPIAGVLAPGYVHKDDGFGAQRKGRRPQQDDFEPTVWPQTRSHHTPASSTSSQTWPRCHSQGVPTPRILPRDDPLPFAVGGFRSSDASNSPLDQRSLIPSPVSENLRSAAGKMVSFAPSDAWNSISTAPSSPPASSRRSGDKRRSRQSPKMLVRQDLSGTQECIW